MKFDEPDFKICKASEEQKTIALCSLYTDATKTLTLEDKIAIENEEEKC